jgi:hypothetical protein
MICEIHQDMVDVPVNNIAMFVLQVKNCDLAQ